MWTDSRRKIGFHEVGNLAGFRVERPQIVTKAENEMEPIRW
jgi:hypothetical protein